MKYICLSEKGQLMDACFVYEEELQKNGHFNIDARFAGKTLTSDGGASNHLI